MQESKDSLQKKIHALDEAINNTREEFKDKLNELTSELNHLRKLSEEHTLKPLSSDAISDSTQTDVPTVNVPTADMPWVDTIGVDTNVVDTSGAEHLTDNISRPDNNVSDVNTARSNQSVSSRSVYRESAAATDTDKVSTAGADNKIQSVKAAAADGTQAGGWGVEPPTPAGQKKQKVNEPGVVQVLMSKAFETAFSQILSLLLAFTAPFHELYHRLVRLYFHYQKQGKAPVFLMTVAGLITLTVGFGYLLQYSFNTLFSDTLKAVSGYVIGAGIVGAGVLLSRKSTDFKDYGASVIALGIIFSYLTSYFVGPYYGLVSESSGLILLLCVTLAAFSLSIIFETRVVSAITLVGGVLMPFIVGDIDSAGLVFVLYLFVLSVGNLYISHKIKWPALAQITFFLSLSVIEYIGISDAVHPYAALAIMSAFFYVYLYFWCFDGAKLKDTLSKHDLSILVANIFYFIYVLLNIKSVDYAVAGVFIVHAVLLVSAVKVLRLMSSIVAPIFMLMIGLLIATAVFVLSPADVTSIIWAIEGLVMLYVGFTYTHKLIRAEGYFIYLVAMAGLLWQAFESFIVMSSSTIAWHWINLFAFGALSFIAYRIIDKFKSEATAFENRASSIINEVFSFWGTTALSVIIVIYAQSAIAVLAIVPLVWSFYRVAQHRLIVSQITGYLLAIAFVIQILLGMFETSSLANSLAITHQPLMSWMAIIELLVFLWILKLFYQRIELSGKGGRLAAKLHTAFYYAPLSLIVFSLYNIFHTHVDANRPLEFGFLWLDFILVGSLIYLSNILIAKIKLFENLGRHTIQGKEQNNNHDEAPLNEDNKETAKKNGTNYTYVLSETLSLFGSVFFLYTMAILLGDWMFNAAVVPMFYLLYRGLKLNLPLTEKLAWLHFALFGVMSLLSYKAVGNFHFSEQPLPTMIGWIEILLSAWAMQLMYERLNIKKDGFELACVVRTGVYLLIPLLFLPRTYRLYPEFVPVALWGSFVISWLMYKKLKIDPLLKELTILFGLAMITTLGMSVKAIAGFSQMPGLIALMTGVIVVSVFHYFEKTLSNKSISESPYHKLILISPYFYGCAIAGFSYAFSHQLAIALVMSGLYFLYLLQERKLLNVMRETIIASYALAWLGLASLPILIFVQLINGGHALIAMLMVSVVSFVSLAGLWFLTHKNIAVLKLLKHRYSNQNIQHWLFHVAVLMGYTGIINLVFSDWSVGVSIAMLIHAVVLLFLTLSEKYTGLLRLSVILYALTAIKVLLIDMGGFGNLHKVIALMCIGSILMLAAYFFQKFRNKQYPQA